MIIKKLEDDTLLVPYRAEWITKDWKNIIWDWIIEVSKDSPDYQKYLKMYNHDLNIALEQKKLLGKISKSKQDK